MKLQEIKDVRVGQVWRNSHFDLALIKSVTEYRLELHQWNYDIPSEHDYSTAPNYMTENACCWKLIGRLGINYIIEDDKLVEMPSRHSAAKINVDDVVTVLEDISKEPFVVDAIFNPKKYNKYISLLADYDDEFSENEVEKLGIYGVHYEFVNSNLGS